MKLLLLLLFLTFNVAAQEVVSNGDFERSTSAIAPWVIRPIDRAKIINPRIVQKAKVGESDDNAFEFGVQSDDNHAITQTVAIPSTGDYIVTLHAGVVFPLASRWVASAELRLGNQQLIQHTWARTATVQSVTTTLVEVQVARLQAGNHTLSVIGTTTSASATLTVDDISIKPVPFTGPYTTLAEESIRGTTVVTSKASQPNILVQMFVAPRRSPIPIRVPGISGFFTISPVHFIVVGAGVGSFNVRVPGNAMTPRVVYFQAFEFNQVLQKLAFGPDIGPRVRQ